jgi:hypothetical protein
MIICSCLTNKKLIEKSEIGYVKIKFFEINTQDDKSSISKVYAEVDSVGVKRFYSFYSDEIVMTDKRAKGRCYTVIYHKLPNNYEINTYNRFSKLDTLVFTKAEKILETSKYSHLKRLKGAEGYQIEVYYYHGFPKNKRFKPL